MSLAAGQPVEGPSSGPSESPSASSRGWKVGARRRLAGGTWSGVVVALAAVLPPLAIWARRWVVGEAVQFSLLSCVVPPLLVLGLSPATRDRLVAWPALSSRNSAPSPRSGRALGQRSSRYRFDPLVDRPGRGAFDPAAARAWVALLVFVAVVAFWRSSPMVNALSRRWPLVLLEAATLVAAGCALWLNLLSGSSVAGGGRPRRMAIAAVAMWSIWALAFVIGFSNRAMFSAYHHQLGLGLSALGDQELAVAVLFAIPGLAFVPVVFANFASWLRSQEGAPRDRPGPVGSPSS